MNSNNDALVAQMEHDPTLLWHGPPLPSVPADLLDLVAEIENIKQMQQMQQQIKLYKGQKKL